MQVQTVDKLLLLDLKYRDGSTAECEGVEKEADMDQTGLGSAAI